MLLGDLVPKVKSSTLGWGGRQGIYTQIKVKELDTVNVA
jgi:hypothetical protein